MQTDQISNYILQIKRDFNLPNDNDKYIISALQNDHERKIYSAYKMKITSDSLSQTVFFFNH